MPRRNKANSKPKTKDLAPARRKTKTRTLYPKGRLVRLSAEVYNSLATKMREKESWDEFFRRCFNRAQRNGEQEVLFETWILPSTGQLAPTKALARGLSLKNGVLKGHAGKFEAPLLVRQVI